MKKEKTVMTVLTVLFSLQIITAQNRFTADVIGFLGQTMDAVIAIIQSILGPILGTLIGVNQYDQLFFAKILIFILIFIAIFMGLRRTDVFSGNRPVIFLLSTIVSILSVRFMGDNQFFLAILLPYGALGGAITVFLPLLVYFYFVQTNVPGSTGRRIAWIIYGIFLGAIWYLERGNIGSSKNIYLAGILIIIIFLLFDRTIRRFYNRFGMERAYANSRRREARMIDREIADLAEDRSRGIITDSQYNSELRALRERRRSLS